MGRSRSRRGADRVHPCRSGAAKKKFLWGRARRLCLLLETTRKHRSFHHVRIERAASPRAFPVPLRCRHAGLRHGAGLRRHLRQRAGPAGIHGGDHRAAFAALAAVGAHAGRAFARIRHIDRRRGCSARRQDSAAAARQVHAPAGARPGARGEWPDRGEQRQLGLDRHSRVGRQHFAQGGHGDGAGGCLHHGGKRLLHNPGHRGSHAHGVVAARDTAVGQRDRATADRRPEPRVAGRRAAPDAGHRGRPQRRTRHLLVAALPWAR